MMAVNCQCRLASQGLHPSSSNNLNPRDTLVAEAAWIAKAMDIAAAEADAARVASNHEAGPSTQRPRIGVSNLGVTRNPFLEEHFISYLGCAMYHRAVHPGGAFTSRSWIDTTH